MSRKEKNILFLCTGNYYRSRFAEVLFSSMARKFGLAWHATSRALALDRGINNVGPMSALAINTLESLGIRDTERCSRLPVQVTNEEFAAADMIIALKQDEHLPMLQASFASFVDKVEFWHVDDAPEALPVIEKEVTNLVARLLGGGKIRELLLPEESEVPVKDAVKKHLTLKVGRETAGRRGKGVTTVFDTGLDEVKLLELGAKLKQRCGTGGTVKDGRIEIQGDQRERVIKELEALGFKVKRVGG